MKRLLVFGLGLSIWSAVGCSDGDEPSSPDAGKGGSGGESGGSSTGACPGDGEGTVIVQVTGLPADVDGDVALANGGARETVAETKTFADERTGTYTVTAKRVTDADPIVRTVYDPTVTDGAFCLEDGTTHTVTVHYAAIPSSNQLWTSNLRGFESALLADDGDVRPSVVGDAPIGKDVAFDRDGNLWSLGATLAEKMLVRVPASHLATSGDNDFDREIDLPEIECLPALKAMAFDGDGNLWLGACGGTILQIPAASLARSGEASSATVISGLEDSADLAFDADGNLWVATGPTILRYDADRLRASTTAAPDLTLTARDAEDSRDIGATGLAFDAHGNLWGFDFGGNFVFELSESDLAGTGVRTAVSEVSFVLGVLSLLDRGAFDEGGGIWVSYASDQLARLSPAQLTESRGTGDPVTPDRIVTGSDLESALRVAFFPAPEALPLYHTAFPH